MLFVGIAKMEYMGWDSKVLSWAQVNCCTFLHPVLPSSQLGMSHVFKMLWGVAVEGEMNLNWHMKFSFGSWKHLRISPMVLMIRLCGKVRSKQICDVVMVICARLLLLFKQDTDGCALAAPFDMLQWLPLLTVVNVMHPSTTTNASSACLWGWDVGKLLAFQLISAAVPVMAICYAEINRWSFHSTVISIMTC